MLLASALLLVVLTILGLVLLMGGNGARGVYGQAA